MEGIAPGAGFAVAAVLGLVSGSFANVCIHRMPDRRSVVWPGSSCPACGAPIRWYDNIPVASWLLLAGQCRSCRASIPAIYPLVELASLLLLLGLYSLHGMTLRWAALSWLAVSILVLVPIDLRHGILPDRVTLPGLTAALLASLFTSDPGIRGALTGAAVGGVVPLAIRTLYIVYARARARRIAGPDERSATPGEPGPAEAEREGMGLGDVKMLAMVGAFLGAPRVLLTMLLGSVIGSLIVLPLVFLGRHGMKTAVPFGPFLGVAALISMLWGVEIIDWYLGLTIGPGS